MIYTAYACYNFPNGCALAGMHCTILWKKQKDKYDPKIETVKNI